MSKKIIFTKEQQNEIIRLYTDTDMSILDISKKFNVSTTPITRILKDNGVKLINKKAFVRKHNVNDDYFNKIDTEEKAYWLGFIASDGYITNNRVGIGLSIIDKEHLEKFKKCINSDTDIRIISANGNTVKHDSCDLRFTSQKMVKDLKKYTIVENKTFVLDLNILFKYIPYELIHHVLRGYFDGDGTISQNKITKQPIFSIIATEKNILVIKELLNIKNKIIKEKRRKDSFYIQEQSRENFKNLYNYLYKNSSIFLDRKKEKFEKIIKYM